ncbi:unnamed protein product [Paramecium sonneborni]|uniref:Uncharacterized protein n=1 Tax=Paramecium sonneborni TaxID=65129 RepID=A0A8S1MVL6_9CILI|nr:unnamed protein product [Paramecium sonneborni]
MYFNNEIQQERNKYIFLMNVVSALLDLNISTNCRLTSLVFTRLAYNYSKVLPSEQEKIKKIYYGQALELGSQFNQSLIEGQVKLQLFEQNTVINYIDELRQYIEQEVQDQQLKFILACHLNNVTDALKIEDFFRKYIIQEEARFQKQPYFEVIHSLSLNQLLIYIDAKIRTILNNQQ